MFVGTEDQKLPLHCDSQIIDYSPREAHLGLICTADGRTTEAVKKKTQDGRTYYALLGARLYVNQWIVSSHKQEIHQHIQYIEPVVTYRLESRILSNGDEEDCHSAKFKACCTSHIPTD